MIQPALFVVLVFAVPWLVAPWLPEQPQTRWEVIASYVPGVWAPTVIAIVMIVWTSGFTGLWRELKQRLSFPSGAAVWLLVAALVPILVTLSGVWGARFTGDARPFIPASLLRDVIVNAMLTGAVGEELGWRGFLLSRLDQRVGRSKSALAMGILWSLWHLPVFLFPDSPYASWPLTPALLTIAAFGVFMGALYYLGSGSILPTILAHLSLNIVLAIGGAALSSPVLWWTSAIAYSAIAARLVRSNAVRNRPAVPAYATTASGARH